MELTVKDSVDVIEQDAADAGGNDASNCCGCRGPIVRNTTNTFTSKKDVELRARTPLHREISMSSGK